MKGKTSNKINNEDNPLSENFLEFKTITTIGTVNNNGLGDQGSIPGQVIPKTQKKIFNAFIFNTQYYKVRIKSKVEQSKERSCTLTYTLV